MKTLIRFHSIVLTITTLIVFYLWDSFSDIGEKYPYLTIIIAGISSIGFYKIVTIIIKNLILNIRYLKKKIFGAEYIEGVWVGFFIGKNDNVRYYIETFEQDFESITIRGKGFRENEGYFGSWISESVNFDVKRGTLNYTYKSDALSNSFSNSGLADFVVERKSNNAPPDRLFGFSADLYNPKKMKSFEKKIKDVPDIGKIEEALEKAKQLYLNSKYFLTLEEKATNNIEN